MDAAEQLRLWKEFIEKSYYPELAEKVRKGENWIVIDFTSLASQSPDLADLLLDHPEDTLRVGTLAIEQFELQGKTKNFVVRIKNIPSSCSSMIRDIRSVNLGKLMIFEGVVRQKSDVRPQMTSARFECPSCGNVITVLQIDTKFREPSKCSCGRKGKFNMLSKDLVDAQGLVLEEIPEQIEGGAQPKRMNVLLKNDLVSPLSEKRTNPGARVAVGAGNAGADLSAIGV